jgi:hypothetical protein
VSVQWWEEREYVAVGVAPELVAARAGLALAAAVLLPGVARLVVAVAVELDRQALLRPAAVDPPPTGQAVGLWQHEPGVAQPLEKARFERTEGHADVAVQDPPQLRGAGAVRATCQNRLHVGRRRAVAHAGLVAGAREGVGLEHGGEVDERAGDGRDWDAAPDRAIARVVARARSTHEHAGHAPLRGRCNFRRGRWAGQRTEEMGCRPSAQRRSLAAGQDGGEVPRVTTRRPVTDPIDTPMLAKQRTRPEPSCDLPGADAGGQELATRHHAVRAAGELRHGFLGRPGSWSHSDH